MYSQFSLVRFSSVAFTTTSSKTFDCARNMVVSAWSRASGFVVVGSVYWAHWNELLHVAELVGVER